MYHTCTEQESDQNVRNYQKQESQNVSTFPTGNRKVTTRLQEKASQYGKDKHK